MGIEQLGNVRTVAESHDVREEGARVAKAITELVMTAKLTGPEIWVILIGTVRQLGIRGGMMPGAQLENIRQLYETAAKGEAQTHFFGSRQ